MSKHLFFKVFGLVALVAAANLAAAEGAGPRVVVHVADYAHTPQRILDAAERQAASVYGRIGVTLVWQGGHRPASPDDGDRHLEIVILSGKMTDEKCREDHLPQIAFGSAVYRAQRAVVFFDRAARFAQTSGSSLPLVVGVVLAHELGHLLLPEGTGHTSRGIMRPHWAGRIQWAPDFDHAQGVEIQQLLTARAETAAQQ